MLKSAIKVSGQAKGTILSAHTLHFGVIWFWHPELNMEINFKPFVGVVSAILARSYFRGD